MRKAAKVASLVLTAALVVGVGISAFAATKTPSKTVPDEIAATVETTTTAGQGTLTTKQTKTDAKTEEEKAEVDNRTKQALNNISASVDLKKETGATEEERVEVAAAEEVTVVENTLPDDAQVTVNVKSEVVDTVYEEEEKVTVIIAIPVLNKDGTQKRDENGKLVFTYKRATATVKNGQLRLELTNAQLKEYGTRFTVIALKNVKIAQTTTPAAAQ